MRLVVSYLASILLHGRKAQPVLGTASVAAAACRDCSLTQHTCALLAKPT